MKRKTPQQLRQDAATIRHDCATMLVKADQFEREATAIEEADAAQEEANRCLSEQWFAWKRKLAAVH